jgi:hypothetical protein
MSKDSLLAIVAFIAFLCCVFVNTQSNQPQEAATSSLSYNSNEPSVISEDKETDTGRILNLAEFQTTTEAESQVLNSIDDSESDQDAGLEVENSIGKHQVEHSSNEEAIVFDVQPNGEEYLSLGRPRTAILRAARAGSQELKDTEFYSPAIITDGESAFLISEAREKGNFGGEKLWVVAKLAFSGGTWQSEQVLTTLKSSSLSQIAEKLSSGSHDSGEKYDFVADLAENYQATRLYQSSLPTLADDVSAELYSSRYTSRLEDIRQRYETALEEIGTRYTAAQLSLARSRSQSDPYSEAKRSNLYVNWEYKPHVAENGSYYGQISSITHLPKTINVSGYFRRDGTYVRGHYRSRR